MAAVKSSLFPSLRVLAVVVLSVVLGGTSVGVGAAPGQLAKLDPILQSRTRQGGRSPIIVRAVDSGSLPAIQPLLKALGGTAGRLLPAGASQAATVPNGALSALAGHPLVQRISLDRIVVGAMERTGATIGAAAIRQETGFDGSGVGVAVLDSGSATHDDLLDASGGFRVHHFVDLINGAVQPYDDYGHGTHVAGIIAGNGFDSGGARTGIAPGAALIVLKVLDSAGRGRISDVIAAIDHVIAQRAALNIRVLNLSVATGVYESVADDPLALATERAVRAGIVVVAASGNNGVSPEGRTRYGGVAAPGNAPWVLTVGGFSHMGTNRRDDDQIAGFSSRGPSAIDHAAKPDLVAPAVGIESLAAPSSTLATTWSSYLLAGTVATPSLPYLSLSGTSMAAPAVSGTVALMLQANPSLTPNAVKAILQYTAQAYSSYDPLTQGAGFLNAKGAVQLARHLASPSAIPYPDATRWNRRVTWGNLAIKSGRLTATATAWPSDVSWGAAATPGGQEIDLGIVCSTLSCETAAGRWTVATGKPRNVVWGTSCGGSDCTTTWSLASIVGATDGDTVVWGTTDDGETVVWGTFDDAETVVWGTIDEAETVVWGTSCGGMACMPTVWRQE